MFISLYQHCSPTPSLSPSPSPLFSHCNWMQWDFLYAEGSLTCISSKRDALSSAWIWAWGSGTLEPDFHTSSLCSSKLVFCSPPEAQWNSFSCRRMLRLSDGPLINQANWDGDRHLQAAVFLSFVIYFTRLTRPSDLFMPVRRTHRTIRMFDSTLL